VDVRDDGVLTKETKRIDTSNRDHTYSLNGGRSGPGSDATSDLDVNYVSEERFGFGLGLGLGPTHLHRILMKKIPAVTVATEVEAQFKLELTEAKAPLDQSPPYHCQGRDHADQPYLLLRPLCTHQYESSAKDCAGGVIAPSSTHLRSQVLSAMVLYTTFRLIARIAEIAKRTFLSQSCSRGTRWRTPTRARRYASGTGYVIGPFYLIHALRAVILDGQTCKACIQYAKCSAWWRKMKYMCKYDMYLIMDADEEEDKEQRGRDRRDKGRRQRRKGRKLITVSVSIVEDEKGEERPAHLFLIIPN
jgi:hypothetical protein